MDYKRSFKAHALKNYWKEKWIVKDLALLLFACKTSCGAKKCTFCVCTFFLLFCEHPTQSLMVFPLHDRSIPNADQCGSMCDHFSRIWSKLNRELRHLWLALIFIGSITNISLCIEPHWYALGIDPTCPEIEYATRPSLLLIIGYMDMLIMPMK